MDDEGTKKMAEELGQMNQSVFIPEDASTSAPETDAPTTEVPEESSTEAPSTDAASTDAPSTDAPTTEAPDELTLLREENLRLKAEVDKKVTTKAPPTDAPATNAPYEPEDFVGDMDLDELTSDPTKLNELLNAVFKKGLEESKGLAISGNEGVLRAIPDIVKSNLSIITSLKKASDDFYTENKDLIQWKQAVATVFEEVSAKNPDKTHVENLKTTGDEVRVRLKLKSQATNKNKSPKLPGNKGNKRTSTKPETKGIESEIDAMNKSL